MSGKGCKTCINTFNSTGAMCKHTITCNMPLYYKYEENMNPKNCDTCKHSSHNNSTHTQCIYISTCDFNTYCLSKWKPVETPKAVKFDQDKPRMSLVPPNALEQVAKAMTDGAVKYSDDNYLKGSFSHRRLIDAALRHINAHLQGFDMDISGNTHLSHAAASILMLMEAIKLDKIIDDRFKKGE